MIHSVTNPSKKSDQHTEPGRCNRKKKGIRRCARGEKPMRMVAATESGRDGSIAAPPNRRIIEDPPTSALPNRPPRRIFSLGARAMIKSIYKNQVLYDLTHPLLLLGKPSSSATTAYDRAVDFWTHYNPTSVFKTADEYVPQ